MKKFLYIAWIVFSCGFVALQADESSTSQPSENPTPSPTPTPPPPSHFVGGTSNYSIGSGVSSLGYCAFLRTKAANEVYDFSSNYWDSVFMSESTSGMNKNCCVLRTGGNGDYTYSVPIGRENYFILGLTSQVAFNQFNSWSKNPKAIEMRNYINNKIAEQVTFNSIYADNAYRISNLYTQCSPSTFFNGEGDGINDSLPPGLDGIVNALLNRDNPVPFDANGCIKFCLADMEVGENLIYFDKTVAAEGAEQDTDFNLLPNDKMTVCAHLYNTDPYIPFYRPNGVHRISLIPTN